MPNDLRKPISNFPGYFVDIYGIVWSKVWPRSYRRSHLSGEARKISPLTHAGSGYQFVVLMKSGKRHKRYVHRLVLKTFVGPPCDDQETRHLNGIRYDNRLENLAWGTSKENNADKKIHGTNRLGVRNEKIQGEKHHQAKLTDAQAKEIYLLKYKDTARAIATRFGVKRGTVHSIWQHRQWKHIHEG